MHEFKFTMKKALILSLMLMCFGTFGYAAEPIRLSIVSGPIGGEWYPIGGGMAKLAQTYNPDIVLTLEPGGGVKNARMIGNNPNILGFVMPEMAFYALRGEGEFKEKIPLRLVLVGQDSLQHIVSLEELKINQVEDLRGKKVGVNSAGSNAEKICRTILEFHGITYKDIQPVYQPTGAMLDALKDKLIVAGFITSHPPISTVSELAFTHKIKLISIKKDMLEKMVEKNPFFSIDQIRANTYKGQLTPIDTFTTGQWLAAHANLSEDVVYRFVKAICEHTNELAEHAPTGRFWTAQNTVSKVSLARKLGVPLHPGLEKYLREKGLLK